MRVPITLLTLVVAASMLSAQQNPYVGRWNITGTAPNTDKIYFLEVKQNGDKLEGLFLDRVAHATPVSWIRVENSELVFQYGPGEGTAESPKVACGPIYRVHIENGKLVGRHTVPGDPCPSARAGRAGNAPAGGGGAAAQPANTPPPVTIEWVGVRQPTWPASNANGRHTYGKPVVLVGPGVGLDVWTGAKPGQEGGWKVVDGVLLNEPPTFNPVSKEKFQDFKIDAEFKLDERQNSGLYLRGRYELQLSLGTGSALTAGRQGLLAIYGWKAPDSYAGKPAGEWQVLEVIVVGNHITATLNGQRVHDNAILPAFTGGALDNDELAPGPIMIQGDHSRVSFRKLVVTPVTKAGS